MMPRLLACLVFFACLQPLAARQRAVLVQEEGAREAVPFALLAVFRGDSVVARAWADIRGQASVPAAADSVEAWAPGFAKTMFPWPADTLLLRPEPLPWVDASDPEAARIVRGVLAAKNRFRPDYWHKISYQSYNKFTVTYSEVHEVKRSLNRLLSKFRLSRRTQFDSSFVNHHVLLLESATRRDYYDYQRHKESIQAAKVSGIRNPTMFGMTSQLQPISIYEERPMLLGTEYWGPTIDEALVWYRFRLEASVPWGGDTLQVLSFNPRSPGRIQFLKGVLYVSAKDRAIVAVRAAPNIDKKLQTRYWQSYSQDSAGHWHPHQTETGMLQRPQAKGPWVKAVDFTAMFGWRSSDSLEARQFDEVSVDYREAKEAGQDGYWRSVRQLPLTERDSLTYVFYDTAGSIGNFPKLIRLAEGLYYGELPVGKVDFLLSRMLDFNQFEGVRVGWGMQTNERLLHWASLGGYVGYGTHDRQAKFGLMGHLDLLPYDRFSLLGGYSSDMAEAAAPEWFLDEPQFKSEALRRYRVKVKDRVRRAELHLQGRPLRFLSLRASLRRDAVLPQYDYRFEGADAPYRFAEWGIGLRYAYGEHFLETPTRRVSFGTDYPVAWLQFFKGMRGPFGGDFRYAKLDFKAQQAYRVLGWGVSSWQFRAGKVWGDVPYPRLYHGWGSYRSWAAISYNSFETMGYNEFLSSWYVALFFNHHFGNLHWRRLKRQPSLEMAHNIGFGGLDRPGRHPAGFGTMERGYFESGVFMNNLAVLRLYAVQVGLGAGAFLRYGPYAFPRFGDNLVFKMAIDLTL